MCLKRRGPDSYTVRSCAGRPVGRYDGGVEAANRASRRIRPRLGHRLLPAACLFCLASIILPSCGIGSKPVIGMIPKGSHHIFWQSVRSGAEDAGREFGVRVEWVSPASEAETARQIGIVNSLVERRVHAIALAPIDKKALVPAVQRATANGIPVAVFDSRLESEDYVTFVATDNAGGGRLAARRLGKVLGGRGEVAIVSFMPGSAATIEREQAFQDELRLLFPAIRVVATRYGMAERDRAERITEELLASHAGLSGIFADNESSSVGALRALRKRPRGSLKFVAFDACEELISGLKDGIVDSLVVQDPYRMGYETIRALSARLAGKSPSVYVDSGVRLVLAADLSDGEIGRLLSTPLEERVGQPR